MPSSHPSSILDRVKEAAKSKGLPATQQAIAKVARVNQSSVSRWSETNPPTMENTLLLAKTYGVCVEWLYTGRGPRQPTQGDPRIQELVDLFQLLTDAAQEHVLGYMKYIRSTTFTGDPAHRAEFEGGLAPRLPLLPKARKHR